MNEILVLDLALTDLEAAQDFYEQCESGIGDDFIDSITVDISSLRIHAGIHNEFEGFSKLNSKHFPFALILQIGKWPGESGCRFGYAARSYCHKTGN